MILDIEGGICTSYECYGRATGEVGINPEFLYLWAMGVYMDDRIQENFKRSRGEIISHLRVANGLHSISRYGIQSLLTNSPRDSGEISSLCREDREPSLPQVEESLLKNRWVVRKATVRHGK